jgi:hypothetical protein
LPPAPALGSINVNPLLASVNTLVGSSQHVIERVGLSTRSRYNILATSTGISFLNLFYIFAQVPNEESPVAKVRTEEMAEAPKLVKESEEDSLDVAELPGGILQRRHHPSAVCPSVAITKQRPDSSKLFQFSFFFI